jgi:ribosomal protein S18 acetylase RimI-like enzyme
MYKKLIALLVAFVYVAQIAFCAPVVNLKICQESDLAACEVVFVNAFMKAYEPYTLEELAVKDKELFLKEAFSDVYADFKTGEQKLVVAKMNDTVIGFAGFKLAKDPEQIYITQLAVDPKFWRRGVAANLMQTAFKLYPDATSLVVIARRINQVARNFYIKQGFVESSYMHEGYNPERYVGYEWQEPSGEDETFSSVE